MESVRILGIVDKGTGPCYKDLRNFWRGLVEKPVFVALTKEAFEDFSQGKRYEVRRAERQWNRKQLRPGRKVVLSCGYGKSARLTGKIGRVIFGTLEEIFKRVHFQEIEPRAYNRKVAIRMNRKTLGPAEEYVAFEIIL